MGTTPKIEALLFDLGGVVIDIDFERVWNSWARDAACAVDGLRHSIGRDATYLRYECGQIPLEDYFAHLRGTLNVALTDAQLLAGWNEIFVGEMHGIATVLRDLEPRIPLYAFSNTNRAHEEVWSVRFADVLKPFQKVFVSSTIGLRKPDQASFDHVVAEVGVPASSILFFDDTLENVVGARAAGLYAAHTRSTADIVAALGDYGV
jgi:FMN phosphatase YigB (HAD superfamily)